jgi:hypothetical protein
MIREPEVSSRKPQLIATVQKVAATHPGYIKPESIKAVIAKGKIKIRTAPVMRTPR